MSRARSGSASTSRCTWAAPNPHDTIRLQGEPPLELTIPRGTPGDLATAAAVINAIPNVLAASPGLKTVIDLPPARWRQP